MAIRTVPQAIERDILGMLPHQEELADAIEAQRPQPRQPQHENAQDRAAFEALNTPSPSRGHKYVLPQELDLRDGWYEDGLRKRKRHLSCNNGEGQS